MLLEFLKLVFAFGLEMGKQRRLRNQGSSKITTKIAVCKYRYLCYDTLVGAILKI